jgi:hypothetical protein
VIFHLFVRDELAFCNLSELFIQADQKLGFLSDLLEFRTRKFWQLGHNFDETHWHDWVFTKWSTTPAFVSSISLRMNKVFPVGAELLSKGLESSGALDRL